MTNADTFDDVEQPSAPVDTDNSSTELEARLDALFHDEWRNSAVAHAIAEGIKDKVNEIRWGMSRGHVRNTARERGYLDALLDLYNTLTQIAEQGD